MMNPPPVLLTDCFFRLNSLSASSLLLSLRSASAARRRVISSLPIDIDDISMLALVDAREIPFASTMTSLFDRDNDNDNYDRDNDNLRR